MSNVKVILLCGSQMALPVMRDLFFFKQLSVVVIPGHCKDFILEVQSILKDSIPVIIVSKENYENQLKIAIKENDINVGLMITFSLKLPPSVYELPANGFFNLHPGPLPAYRGPDPIFQQIKNREEHASVTIHKVDKDFDTGAIILTDKIRLDATDTYGILSKKLSELAARLTGTLIKMIEFDIAIPSRQQDAHKAKYFKRQSSGDVVIHWDTMNANTIIALVNACNPWNKGAITKLNQKIIRILSAENVVADQKEICDTPGKIISIDVTGLVVSLIQNQLLRIVYVYADEGFLHASKLAVFGVVEGNSFENLENN